MQPNQLDIEIGKSYPASQILEKIQKNTDDIILGHIIIEGKGKEIIHEYYINKRKLEDLKETSIKVVHIASKPTTQNFANELLEHVDIKEFLEKIKENHTLVCILDKKDLTMYDYNSISQVTKLINYVFESKDMPYKASNHKERIYIKYKNKKEE